MCGIAMEQSQLILQCLFTVLKGIQLSSSPTMVGENNSAHRLFCSLAGETVHVLHEVVERTNQNRETLYFQLDPLQCADELLQMSARCWQYHRKQPAKSTRVIAQTFKRDQAFTAADLCCEQSAFC